jgi:hypothetical protein
MLAADEAVDPLALAEASLGLVLGGAERRPAVRHAFTHRQLTVTPLLGTWAAGPTGSTAAYDAWRWVAPAELAALPRSELMRKLLAAAGQTTERRGSPVAPLNRSG